MDEKFLQKINGLLNDPPEVPFDESAWNQMQQRLDPKPSNKNWLMAAVASILLLLWLVPVGISYAAFQRLDDANNNIAELKSYIKESKNVSTETTPERKSIVVYDTIYKTVIIENITTQNAQKQKLTPQPSYTFFENGQIPTLQNRVQPYSLFQPATSPFSFFVNNPALTSQVSLPSETAVDLSPPEAIDYLPICQLDYFSDPNLNIPIEPHTHASNNKGIRYYLYKMQPSSFALAGNVGQYIATYGTGRGINFTSGLEAEIGYGNNLGFVVGGEYMQWKFDKSRHEEEEHEEEHKLENQFPTVQADSDDDVLNEVYGDFKYIQLPVGFRYTFSSDKALRPSIGLGIAARYPLHAALTYEFLSNFDEYTRDLDNVLEQKFELKSAWASVGLQYALNDHWNFALDGRALLDFDKGKYDYEKLRLFSLRIGMQYGF